MDFGPAGRKTEVRGNEVPWEGYWPGLHPLATSMIARFVDPTRLNFECSTVSCITLAWLSCLDSEKGRRRCYRV